MRVCRVRMESLHNFIASLSSIIVYYTRKALQYVYKFPESMYIASIENIILYTSRRARDYNQTIYTYLSRASALNIFTAAIII